MGAAQYLHAIPTAGNDLVLAMAGALVGGALGVACSLATSVTVGADGVVRSKGGALAAVLWVAGVGARLAFELYATHGGARALGRFSVAHDITSGRAWVACLVLMALCEVVLRTGVLAGRRVTVRNRTAARPTGAAGGPTTRSAGRAPSRVMMGADVPGR